MEDSTRSAGVQAGVQAGVRRRALRTWLLPICGAAIFALMAFGATAMAADEASVLPPNWHIHDGQPALGPQHKGIGFFPKILGITSAEYLLDPARCPNATDKAFLPSFGESQAAMLRTGECQTTTAIIHLRTLPVGTAGPEGWQSVTAASEPGWVTYYLVTSR
jgi:hypothetical protein